MSPLDRSNAMTANGAAHPMHLKNDVSAHQTGSLSRRPGQHFAQQHPGGRLSASIERFFGSACRRDAVLGAAGGPIGSSNVVLQSAKAAPSILDQSFAQSWEPLEPPEPTLQNQPLVLLGQRCADFRPPMGPTRVLWDESRRSFVYHWPDCIGQDMRHRVFQALLEHAPWEQIHGKGGGTLRETCWYLHDHRCTCDYAYGSHCFRTASFSKPEFHMAMEELLEHTCTKLWPWMSPEDRPNCANLNLYGSAEHCVGWHADDESLFMGRDRDCPILSVSLGAPREFWIALKEKQNPKRPCLDSVLEVDLCDGDVLTMEGLCQKHCLHFVPSALKSESSSENAPTADKDSSRAMEVPAQRINVTWRWIREHKPNCRIYSSERDGDRCFFWEQAREVEEVAVEISESDTLHPSDVHVDWWANGHPVAWQVCNSRGHDAWCGGRSCCRYSQSWLCRLCLQRAQKPQDALEFVALAELSSVLSTSGQNPHPECRKPAQTVEKRRGQIQLPVGQAPQCFKPAGRFQGGMDSLAVKVAPILQLHDKPMLHRGKVGTPIGATPWVPLGSARQSSHIAGVPVGARPLHGNCDFSLKD